MMRRSIGALYRTDAEAKKNEQLNCNCTATGFALSRVCLISGPRAEGREQREEKSEKKEESRAKKEESRAKSKDRREKREERRQ